MYLSILALFTTPRERRWSDRRDLNSQQPAWKAGALPIELLPHMTGEEGIEPPTTCPKQLEKELRFTPSSTHQNNAALPLSYSPIDSLKHGSSLGRNTNHSTNSL